MSDSAPEDVGIALCKAHEHINKFGNNWERELIAFTEAIESWLHHPLHRNSVLISDIERIINNANRPPV